MARIRSDKPEAYQSETLAEVSLAAERTFKGMATIADDRGRLPDKPAQINGSLWAMRGNHTKDDLEGELRELVAVGLVCRYMGCDGKRYLHMVSWDQHQKIDRPSKSRLPRCLRHPGPEGLDYCGLHEGECILPDPSRESREPSRDLQHTQNGHAHDDGYLASTASGDQESAPPCEGDDGPVRHPEQGERKSSRESREPSMQDLGSRTVDRGPRTTKPASPDGDAGDVLEGSLIPVPVKPESVNQRINRLAKTYTDRVRLSNFNAVAGIVRKAVNAEHDDDTIVAGLSKVAASGRSLTVESLRVAIEGKPRSDSTGEDRARQAMDAGQQAARMIEEMSRR
jgi:hypothetical protein